MAKQAGPPSVYAALAPIIITLGLLGLQLFVFQSFNPQVPLAMGIAITTFFGWRWGLSWQDMEDGLFRVIIVALPSIALFLLIGMIISAWIAAGTLPLLVYYGLKSINPAYFLATSLLFCAAVSISLGTSWGTVATVGIALLGIGDSFGYPAYMTAGAVISGAFFGDKMSPLSDTTNLAPAITGVALYDHIKNMIPTALPAMLISLAAFTALGLNYDFAPMEASAIAAITDTLAANFNLSLLTLLPPLVVLSLALCKIAPLPTLFLGALAGSLCALLLQGAGLAEVFAWLQDGYALDTGNQLVDKLFSRGGMASMTWVLTLVLVALGFGGALEKVGSLGMVARWLVKRIGSFKWMQTTAILSAVATNAVAGDSYLALVLPSRLYRQKYKDLGYSALNLSRAVEEGGTLVAPLIPWCATGAFIVSTLGLTFTDGNQQNLLYIPMSFGCWISPLLGVCYAWLGWFSPRREPDSDERERQWQHARQAGQGSAAHLQQPVRSFLEWYDPEHTMYFSSPARALIGGVRSLDMPLAEVARRGDLGLGVLSDRSGSFVMDAGQVYCLDPAGRVIPTPVDGQVAFGTMTRFEAQTTETIAPAQGGQSLEDLLPRLIPSDNMIYALRAEGDFARARLASGQTLGPVRGVVVGVYTPEFLAGAGMAGFSLFFLAHQEARGGLLADAVIERVEFSLMQVTKMEVGLPLTLEYMTAELGHTQAG